MAFLFDTNSLSVLNNYYPETFITFWDNFQASTDAGEVLSVLEVYREVKNNLSEHLDGWVEENKYIFLEPDEDELDALRDLMSNKKAQEFVRKKQISLGSPVADPFLLVSAQIHGHTIVTEEKYSPNAAKIPTFCKRMDINCITIGQYMLDKKWVF